MRHWSAAGMGELPYFTRGIAVGWACCLPGAMALSAVEG